MATGAELPEPDDQPADLVELHRAVSDADLWTNDLFSCVQEAERGDPHNLVLVLAEARNRAPDDAVRDVAEMVQGRIDTVARLVSRVEEHGVPGLSDSGLAAHLHSLQCWVSGQLVWRYETGRFVPDAGNQS